MEPHLISRHGRLWREASVLVVDDEPPLRRLIRRRLEAEQFRVEEASDGESAMRLIQSRPFDLVLTDLSMPGIDGRQIQATLKRYRPTIAVLCMSAQPEELPPIDVAETSIAVLRKRRVVPRYPGRTHSRFGSQGSGGERDRSGQCGIEPTGADAAGEPCCAEAVGRFGGRSPGVAWHGPPPVRNADVYGRGQICSCMLGWRLAHLTGRNSDLRLI